MSNIKVTMHDTTKSSPSIATEIPQEFIKIMKDFYCDMLNTFPEYEEQLTSFLEAMSSDNTKHAQINQLFEYCKQIYPARFFDLLYQNEDIFTNDEINTFFLPNIDFKNVWSQDISDNTRTIIWKYLQLICFTVVNNQNNCDTFGDTASLFEAIDENELKSRLEETMNQMSAIFDMSTNPLNIGENNQDVSGVNMDNLPNPEELHKHISGLLDGKLGRLATEITEETMKDFEDIADGAKSIGDVFKVLFKDPSRLMKMVKKVGGNLDAKLKSGEIKESELMEEAAGLMEKLQKMPGMKNMQKMMSEMGMPMNGQYSKANMGAFQSQMKRNMRQAKTRDRLRQKLQQRENVHPKNQIQLLQQQLAAARAINNKLESATSVSTKTSKNKKRRNRRKRKGRTKK